MGNSNTFNSDIGNSKGSWNNRTSVVVGTFSNVDFVCGRYCIRLNRVGNYSDYCGVSKGFCKLKIT